MAWKKIKEDDEKQQATWLYEHMGIVRYEQVPLYFQPCKACGHNWTNIKLQDTCIFCKNEVEISAQEIKNSRVSIRL